LDLIEDHVITVKNFGTLSPHTRASHSAHDVSSGQIRTISAKRAVKFHPHESFLSLLKDREELFREKEDEKKS